MGSAFTPGGNTQGVVTKVMDSIFQRIGSSRDAEYTVRVGFVEIHKVSQHAHTDVCMQSHVGDQELNMNKKCQSAHNAADT